MSVADDLQRDDLTVAVVGAGTRGRGIAQVCAHAGMTALLFDTSTAAVCTVPCADSSAAVFAMSSVFRSQIDTFAPDARNRSAIARPNPSAPPVMTARRPLKSNLFTPTPFV